MKFLVTGGFGFIGSNIAAALVRKGHGVRVLDNLSSSQEIHIKRLSPFVEFIEGDVRDQAICDLAVQGCHGVFHEAALVSVQESIQRPFECQSINAGGTLNILEAMRAAGVRRIVFASSAAIYGDGDTLPKTEDMQPEPISPYAVSKLTGEQYLRSYAQDLGFHAVALRYFNVFGPGQNPRSLYSGVVSKFIEKAQAGQPLTIFGDGGQTRDFVAVDDVVRVNCAAMEADLPERFSVFNVGTGQQQSLLDLVAVLQDQVPHLVETIFEAGRDGDIRYSAACIDRMKTQLGLSPAPDSFEKGLKAILESSGPV